MRQAGCRVRGFVLVDRLNGACAPKPGADGCATAPEDATLSICTESSIMRIMATRRTVPVEIDIGTVALAELAAARHGMPVAEWIARAARRELVSISPGPNYVELTEAEMLAEDAQRAADEAVIAAADAKRFRAAG